MGWVGWGRGSCKVEEEVGAFFTGGSIHGGFPVTESAVAGWWRCTRWGGSKLWVGVRAKGVGGEVVGFIVIRDVTAEGGGVRDGGCFGGERDAGAEVGVMVVDGG